MNTLITAQEKHITRLLNATPYAKSNGAGYATILNRKVRTIRASRRQYRKDLEKLGITDASLVFKTMEDAEDMAILEFEAES